MPADHDQPTPPPDAVAGYLRHLEVERRMPANTRLAYARDLARLVAFAAKKARTLEALTRQDLEELARASMVEGRSATSTARLVSGVRGFYRYLLVSGRIAPTPPTICRRREPTRRLPRFLAPDEVEALLAAPDVSTPRGLRDRALLEVLYATGLRVTELVKLKMTEVRRDEGYLQFTGKGNKERIVPLGETARDWIDRYVREARPALCRGRETPDLFISGWRAKAGTRPAEAADARGVLETARRLRPPRRNPQPSVAARAPAFVRHAPARARRRSARDSVHARPRGSVDDADLHARAGSAAPAGLRPVSPARVT